MHDAMVLKHPFHAPNIKIERALKHVAELEAEVESFVASDVFNIGAPGLNIPGKIIFATHLTIPPVPPVMSAILGDIIHNLRSALDLTACEMANANGQDIEGVYFPFCRSVDGLDEMIKRRKFDRAGPGAVALLRELKPYHGGNAALRAVHDLDVRDKHQSLIPGVMNVASPII